MLSIIYYIIVLGNLLNVFAGEFSVYKEILTGYDKNIRPYDNNSLTIVSVELTYFTLLYMDQKQETITFMTELEVIWKNDLLKFNASEFGVASAVIPYNLVWRPDIIVITGLDVDYLMPEDQRFVEISSDGTVRSASPCVITNSCHLQIAAFPFDEQTCNVNLGSWMYNSSRIELVIGQKRMLAMNHSVEYGFKGNSEWTLLSTVPIVHRYELGDGTKWVEIQYDFQLKRQPIYYVCVLLIPTFLTATICLCGLFVPAVNTGDRVEKVNMGLATLMSMAIILGIVAGEMPKATTLPLLGYYVLAELMFCTVGVCIAMLIMMAHQRASTRVLVPPNWIKTVVFFKLDSSKRARLERYTTKVEMNGNQPLSIDQKMDHKTESFANSFHMKRLNQVVNNVEEYVESKKFEEQMMMQWIIIFDRIDMFFLILFNLANIILSGSLLF